MALKKKAFLQDFIYIGFFLVVLAICMLFSAQYMHKIFQAYTQPGVNETHTRLSYDLMKNSNDRVSTVWNYLFLVIFVFAMLSIFISMFFIETHPALFFVVLIIGVFILIIMAVFNNVYFAVSQAPGMAEERQGLPAMTWIFDHWMLLMVVFIFVSVALLFAKLRTGWFR